MAERRRYLKKPNAFVVAVQLDLETEGFTYHKWGDTQTCRPGDWILNNSGEVYTVDREVFERTYRETSPGIFAKHTPVWAELADRAGSIRTREGVTHYEAGAYLVFNDPDGEDGWALDADFFHSMYEPA